MKEPKCKICRRSGVKLFLKGERCFSPKCSMVRRPYPPGFQNKKRRRFLSDYGKQLREKQKLKNWYNLSEHQFKKYVKGVLERSSRGENASVLLIERLETRLDNVVFRLGFAESRSKARQLVSHGCFLINGKKVNIPSYRVRKGDKIDIRPSFLKKKIFNEIDVKLKKHQSPSWLKSDIKKLKAEVIGRPSLEETAPPVELSTIFEFYSR